MKNKRFCELVNQIPIEIRIKTANQMAFIDLIAKFDYIGSSESWAGKESKLDKIISAANCHTETIITEIYKQLKYDAEEIFNAGVAYENNKITDNYIAPDFTQFIKTKKYGRQNKA